MVPEDDLVLLGLKIAQDPQTYREEYLEQLRRLEALLNLPSPPVKQIKPMIFFIVRHSSIDPAKSVNLLISSLDAIKEYKTRRVVLDGLTLMRQKKYIETRELIRLIVIYGHELSYFVKSAQEFLDVHCYTILRDWYKKGTERQKSFCYFLLLVLFSKIHDVGRRKEIEEGGESINQRLEIAEGGSCSSCTEETANEHDPDTSSRYGNDGSMPSDDTLGIKATDMARFDASGAVVDLEELESLICEAFFVEGRLSKTCCLYFLNRTEVRFDISGMKRGEEYANKIFRSLSSEVMDRDIKLMKIRIFVLFKQHFKVRKSVLKIVMGMIDLEREDLKDLLDCIVASVEEGEALDALESIATHFVNEGQRDEIVVLGMNVMREIYSKFLLCCEGEESKERLVEEMKKRILGYIGSFAGNRTKCIFYAYKMVIKAVVEHEMVERPVSHIKQKADKERKEMARKKGKEEVRRRREEAKREEKKERYKNRKKGRKKSTMARLMRRPGGKTKR